MGITGSDEKCRWVESLGADVCLNYKKPGFYEDLANATDGFVDVFFDNVGVSVTFCRFGCSATVRARDLHWHQGELLDFMLTRLKMNGIVAACGSVSSYNSGAPNTMPSKWWSWYRSRPKALEKREGEHPFCFACGRSVSGCHALS